MKKQMLRRSLALFIAVLVMASTALAATEDFQVNVASAEDVSTVNVSVDTDYVCSGSNLRAGPSTDYDSFGWVEAGTTVHASKRGDNRDQTGCYWYLVKVTDKSSSLYGLYGWIYGGNLSVA